MILALAILAILFAILSMVPAGGPVPWLALAVICLALIPLLGRFVS
jgi:hypothetical protein